jgi:pilus assembly protein CpaE
VPLTLPSATTVRILIVDDNRLTIENVSRLIDFEAGLLVVGSARTGAEAVQRAQELRPDIVLMDINMPDMDGIEACRQIAQSSPRTRVMMMSVQSDTAYLKQAMNAGAREFLIKPFDYDELINAIRRVHAAEPTPAELAAIAAPQRLQDERKEAARAAAVRTGVVVAVLGVKGGAGASTVATNLALALRESRRADVLLIDADMLFGDLDVLLDLHPPHRILDVLEMFDPDDPDLVRRMVTEHRSGISFLAGPAGPELAELVLPELMGSLLQTVRSNHDYVVIDLGSRYEGLSPQLLEAADRILVTLTPEVTAVKNANLLLGGKHLRPYPVAKVIPLVNKYNQTWGIDPEAIGKALGRPVGAVIPADGPAMLDAANRGQPVVMAAPRARAARPFLALEKLIPSAEELARERMAAVARSAPAADPVRTLPNDELLELGQRLDDGRREGCARWIPFLRRRADGGRSWR